MDLGLSGKVALVTGASSGLGAAIARELAAEGAAVALVARRAAELERVAAEIARPTLVIPADVTEAGAAERCVHLTEDSLGPVDILLANAGGPPSTTFDTTTDAHY
ncbi:MAG TPA: SDR family NAD(P)-dependent oxidoreductase, partial [Gemmatimonadaceae bacterium]|nr:SDR family NAD(P)-dependent oxidoreductase [Gemmatimonadaceae bacterium]